MRRSSLALIVAAVAMAGCGSSHNPKSEVRAVIEQYYAALEKGNGAKACSLYTESAREEIAREMRSSGGPPKCTPLLSIRLGLHLDQPLKIVSVSMMGNRATVVLHKPQAGSSETATLVKTPRGWRIQKSLVHVLVIR